MERIRIINWEKFQHYKNREPPWIKLHNSLLNDYEFRCLQDASKLLLILLWLVRSRISGDIPADDKYIKDLTGHKGKIDLKPLIDKGFIECYQDASTTLASCAPEREAEREAEINPPIRSPLKKKHLDFVMLTDEEHTKLLDRFGRTGAASRIENLNNYLGQKGKRYKSHYHTILVWEKGNGKNDKRIFDGVESKIGTTISAD